jgi:catechol 2,3-dioxygenase-like lactoylglutathione lyase family enzyme
VKEFPIYAVLPCSDAERARAWYLDKLAMSPDKEEFGSHWYECAGGTWMILTPSQYAGTAQNTAAGWQVSGIETLMDKLRGNGVVFEDYDMPGFKTENGLFAMGLIKAAWFKDSEGNILEISEVPGG